MEIKFGYNSVKIALENSSFQSNLQLVCVHIHSNHYIFSREINIRC